jgi:hypothetical protein
MIALQDRYAADGAPHELPQSGQAHRKHCVGDPWRMTAQGFGVWRLVWA